MKRSTETRGMAVLFFKTDMEDARPISKDALSGPQRQVFARMSKAEQRKVLDGFGAAAVDLASGETLCTFNMEHFRPPKEAAERFARQLLRYLREKERAPGDDGKRG